MFWHFFRFEIKYWLKSVMLWVFLAIIALLFLLAESTDQLTIGGALGNTFRNAPFIIQNFDSIVWVFALLMMTAFVNAAASREFEYNTHQIMFTAPIAKFGFLSGRFLGSALISVIPSLGMSLGVLLAKHMPWADADRFGPVVGWAHVMGAAVFIVPNTLLFGAVIFTIAVLTRSRTASFIGSLLVLVGVAVAQALTSDLRNETLSAMVDPTGAQAFSLMTKYWTVSDKNHLVVGYTGLMLWNRLIWIGVALLIFGFACWRFSFAERSKAGKAKKQKAELKPVAALVPAVVHRSYGVGAQWALFFGSVRIELKRLLKTTVFIVIGAAALLNCIPSLIFSATEGYGLHSLPVTYRMVEIVEGTLYLFLVGIIVFFAGVLVWEERDTRTDEINDVTPSVEWPGYAAKFVALMASVVILLGLASGAAVVVQLAHHYTRLQLGLYGETLFGVDLSGFLFLGVLAFFIHVLSPNKYIGYFAFIGFVILNAFVWRPLHVGTDLVRFAARPSMTYSDFFHYTPYLPAWLWFTLYWGLFCGLLAVASVLLWPRGRETKLATRLKIARGRFSVPVAVLTSVLAVAFVGTGVWIYINTEVWNRVQSQNDRDKLQADYEKTYKNFQGKAMPRIVDVKYAIDLYPETRSMTMTGDETIKNETTAPLTEIHFVTAENYKTEIALPGSTVEKDDPRLHYSIYKLTQPMQPGEERPLHFVVSFHPRGFENDLTNIQIAQNGTFFNNGIAPQIGYQDGGELTDPNTRKRFGLKPKDLMPALERNCTVDCMNTYLSNNSDWVNVDTVISTTPSQIAVAPGSLLAEWRANGRRYFHYKLDHKAMNFYAFISADYVVRREKWNGIDVEVYSLKEHPWNVPRMVNSIEKSLGYYTANFGPYYEKQARIIEFPRVASFAQSFPGTMPYSESIGFIADLGHPDDIDMVFYVVAHEMAHQYWAHQVVGANMQGATLLSETQAQYSALMVMEKEYGANAMRKFLSYEMDRYLRSRGAEQLKERPLIKVEASQGYIHYRKGSVIMYALKERIGEDKVNQALRAMIAKYAYADPPYPVSYALVDDFAAVTPADAQQFLKDSFYDITLFSNRTLSATAKKRPDGQYDVTIEVEAHKLKADEKGNEREVPMDDLVEIGAVGAVPKGYSYGKLLVRLPEHIVFGDKGGKATYTFVSPTLPDKAGIDPRALLIDRVPDDNLKAVTVQ
jgi:ABC-type transport system involved in multi-copper enzyme maturation permease subunit